MLNQSELTVIGKMLEAPNGNLFVFKSSDTSQLHVVKTVEEAAVSL